MTSGSYNTKPIHTQPQWHNQLTPAYQDHLQKPTAVVPPGLQCLAEVEEVILQKKVFQTNAGQILFSVYRVAECCGPGLNLRLRDPYKREVVSMYLVSSGGCCGGETYLKIETGPNHPLGFVSIANTSKELNVSIQMENREPVFSARMPIFLDSRYDNTIEILSVSGNHPVAIIRKEKEHRSSKVIFHFPLNLTATLKAVILGTFLYMTYRVNQLTTSSSSSSSSTADDGWATAGGMAMGYDIAGGSDWGNDGGHCGGGDWGGGGGDCGGGGGGGDCGGGGGGGDCGGGGGDCGGGGGGGDSGGGGCD
ncbi:keratin, type I cytoskeletal 9-like [Pseudophryne corroboree]|uniref:keratin, type I cytoskeletal 9-like n=1 Tax=Pseudophryne corroboree TaxID=495146 RepID=UPI0030821295